MIVLLRPTLRHFVPYLASLGHLTVDKRLRYASPKLSSATSFTPRTLYEMVVFTILI